MDEDDDTQVYKDHGDALTIAYQSGYYDGKKAAKGLSPAQLAYLPPDPDFYAADTAIVQTLLPKLYSIIDRLLDGQDKALVIEARRVLPKTYKNAFEKEKK